MRYADGLLSPGEVVVVRARQHWLALAVESRTGLALLGVALVLLVVVVADAFGSDAARTVISTVALVALLIGLAFFLFHAWQWWAQDYLITNRRILKVEGIINKRSADSSLEKINDAVLEQDLFGRLFGYGDLDILTAADAAIDRYRMLDRAPQFKREMLSQKYQLEREVSGAMPSPPLRTRGPVDMNGEPASRAPLASHGLEPERPTPVPVASGKSGPERASVGADPREITELLGRLADLRDRGAITPGEYEAKKTELLARL